MLIELRITICALAVLAGILLALVMDSRGINVIRMIAG